MASVLIDRQRRIRGFLPRSVIAILLTLALQPSSPLSAQDRLLPVFYFRQVEGLSSNEIRSNVVRDREGFIWVGTLNGLDRYDGYSVKEYRNDPKNPNSISSNIVRAVFVDGKGRLWVGMYDSGLSLYDPAHDRFINFIPRPGDSTSYESKTGYSFSQDRSGNIWMATLMGGVVRVKLPPGDIQDLDSLARGVRFTTYPLGTSRNHAFCMHEREDGTLLVGTDSGMINLDPVTRVISRLHFTDPIGRRLDSLPVYSMKQDRDGNLWLGTFTGGLFRIDRDSRMVANYRHRERDETSLKSDVIFDITENGRGDLWIGSAGGVDQFSPSTGKCLAYLTIGSQPQWPVDFLRMSLDRDGVLWVGTMDGGLHWLSPKSQRFPLFGLRDRAGSSPIPFTSVKRDGSGGYWLMSAKGVLYQIDIMTRRVVKQIDVLRGKQPSYGAGTSFIDRRGTYWYGTWGLGLYWVDLRNGQVENYSVEAGLAPSRIVNSIAEGEGDTLWIATVYDGLMKFHPGSGRFTPVTGLPAGNSTCVMKDHGGTIWMGSEQSGLTIIDPATGAKEHLQHVPSDPRSLSSDHVRCTFEDSSGRIWVGAGNEINLWDPATHLFSRYTNPGFLRSLFVDLLGSDHKGRLWVRHFSDGVAVLNPSDSAFTNFDMSDGIDAGSPMEPLPDGRMMLTHWRGVNIFHPDSINLRRPAPPLVITAMSINDEPAASARPIGTSAPIRLQYSQNALEFEFAAIDIDVPQLVEYQYTLEGLEKEWVRPKDRRFVRYPSLPPGDYVFKVRAASSRREWPEQEIALAISIAPPWWRATWAYAAYGVIVVSLLFAAYRLRLRQIQLKQAAEMEHFQSEHLAEVDRLKSRFFSNISHEFRTPLTLILGPAKQAVEAHDIGVMREKLRLITDNAKTLLGLVNQLLDFSRVESGMMRLRVSSGDVVQLLRRVVMSFESWAERKKINLEFCCEAESVEGLFDRDKLEKIVNNLMSNALKFTPEGGRIAVSASKLSPSLPLSYKERGTGGEFLKITVADTGPGIAPNHLPHIFDRFYRVEETHTTEGTGIGLALTKELVELHHGTIAVESPPGKGSVFTVVVPIGREAYTTEEITETAPGQEEERPIDVGPLPGAPKSVPTVSAVDGKPIVLVVEDNADLRAYIREYLENDYAVAEAGNGKEGYGRAVESVPDLVISDVMMPEMDGMELCRSLKQDVRTSHVPVILLTARAGIDSKIEGLEIGADDYVTKPFDAKELLARVRNLVEQRRNLRERFSRGVELKPGEVAVTSLDDALLRKVMAVVEGNIGDENLGVEDLAREACLSQRQLGRKLLSLTNLTPAEFIRYVRLQRAHELLEKNAGSVAEIAFQVGFGSPSYFTSCFHQRFGYPPSGIRHPNG